MSLHSPQTRTHTNGVEVPIIFFKQSDLLGISQGLYRGSKDILCRSMDVKSTHEQMVKVVAKEEYAQYITLMQLALIYWADEETCKNQIELMKHEYGMTGNLKMTATRTSFFERNSNAWLRFLDQSVFGLRRISFKGEPKVELSIKEATRIGLKVMILNAQMKPKAEKLF